tara:strand:- start:932 stop:2119 length:1188 start_codon:yes stop_codon:yes gene_type:complete
MKKRYYLKNVIFIFSLLLIACSQNDDILKTSVTSEEIINYCHGFSDDTRREGCYYNNAIQYFKEDLCLLIKSNPLSTYCKILTKPTLEQCNLHNDKQNLFNECLKRVAILTKNVELCRQMKVRTNEIYTDNNCLRSIAIHTGNLDICEEIGDFGCTIDILSDLNPDNFCNEFLKGEKYYIENKCKPSDISTSCTPGEFEFYDSCLKRKIWRNPDPKFCDMMKTEFNKNICFGDVSSLKNDPNICRKILDSEHRDLCIENIAEHNLDVSLCQKLPKKGEGFYHKDNCIERIAIELSDVNLCIDLINPDDCFFEISRKILDDSLCEKITLPKEKDRCYRWIAFYTENINYCQRINDEDIKHICNSDKFNGIIGVNPDSNIGFLPDHSQTPLLRLWYG